MRCVVIIQARMGSTRLPGKVLMKLCGRPIVQHVAERLALASRADLVVVATSTSRSDDPLAEFLSSAGIPCFRGSEDDVLARYRDAARQFPADIYVRGTSDNPMADPGILDGVVDTLIDGDARYAASKGFPLGMGVEAFTAEMLDEAASRAAEPHEHEHVTPYMREKNDRIAWFTSPRDLSSLRCTVDTPEDLAFAERVYAELYDEARPFTADDVIALAARRPELAEINRHVHQKGVRE